MGSRLRTRKQRHDTFFRKAKEEHYPARSVYKLEELDRRFQILRPGQTVLDFGCRPGSWLLYASRKIGPSGLVVGIDRSELDIPIEPNMRQVVGDIRDLTPEALGEFAPCLQTVLSDLAPDTSGVAFADQIRCVELFLVALELSAKLGCPGGHFVGKIFMGEGFDNAVLRAKQLYRRTKTVKPEATRKESKELYVVALDRKPLLAESES